MSMITHWRDQAPEAPYYAVIFISKKSNQLKGYQEMDELMMKEAHQQAGFLGYSSQGSAEGGIFISYWRDLESIDQWRHHAEHQQAKAKAYDQWYSYFHSMICKVESSQLFIRDLQEQL